ncbi:hypothetical protein NEFER03_1849 [Nematocida sp. LUAm3]|nr:hypothetical protein NEFER03_1849 [Nematocida sp. LUAm3]KAI5174001.1 hypothetical protein NEFER02_0468 [Nematocida sp. LUAm2]KAI5177255.1 hypothetical protein NEFER01_0530 [Nematocida sp. LUAm1]
MSASQEFKELLKRASLKNKFAFPALQVIAETNGHYAKDIAHSIEEEIKESPEKQEALSSLLELLSSNTMYTFLMKPQRKRKASPETSSKKILKEERIEKDSSTEQEPPKKPSKEKKKQQTTKNDQIPSSSVKPSSFYPYPVEFLLFKLTDKKEYLSSFQYYTKSKQEEEDMPPLPIREYLCTPRFELAQKFLYFGPAQCKVCGMRFTALDTYSAHNEAHKRKSQIDRTASEAIYRPWLQRAHEWTGDKQETPKISFQRASFPQSSTENVLVKGDRDQLCTLCKDAFEVIWSDEDESWIFKDAILIRSSPTRQICHRKCVS